MNSYKVRFVEYGEEFTSAPMKKEFADILIRRLEDRGICTAYRVKISKVY